MFFTRLAVGTIRWLELSVVVWVVEQLYHGKESSDTYMIRMDELFFKIQRVFGLKSLMLICSFHIDGV
jgi:hypothetical protein